MAFLKLSLLVCLVYVGVLGKEEKLKENQLLRYRRLSSEGRTKLKTQIWFSIYVSPWTSMKASMYISLEL